MTQSTKTKRGKKISITKAKATAEEKFAANQKRLKNYPLEQQRAALIKFHASQTPEERSARVKGNSTAEERSERGKRAAAKIPHEVKSAQVRYQQANLTLEQKEQRAKRAQKVGADTRWINNGLINRRLKQEEQTPAGWVYGKIPKRADSNLAH